MKNDGSANDVLHRFLLGVSARFCLLLFLSLAARAGAGRSLREQQFHRLTQVHSGAEGWSWAGYWCSGQESRGDEEKPHFAALVSCGLVLIAGLSGCLA